jgi:ABC-type glutathione transport system ATPase component
VREAVPRAKVIDLATCAFVERKENVLLVGPTGVGKSHIAQALGHRACRAGHSAIYTSAHDMLTPRRCAREGRGRCSRQAGRLEHGPRQPRARRVSSAVSRRTRVQA